ncbi:hypothetical protein [Streptomyces sp. LN704]|uniref:hypothetical protein n=1 Tax=Streptomyces sp. LN704 TaxID=3112982 RepID=UPI0037214F57
MTTQARPLTASASRYVNRKVRAVKAATDSGWQSRAWQLYQAVPEVRFAATYMANGMAGATLYAARRADDGTIEPPPTPTARRRSSSRSRGARTARPRCSASSART